MSKQKHNWEKLKNEYITVNLSSKGKSILLKELAKEHGISKSVLWNRARKEGWGKELKEAKRAKNKELSVQVQKAAVDIDKGDLMEEYKVRSENYKTATKLLGKLLKRWDNLTDAEINEISSSDLIKGMLACLKARAEAAGLPSQFQTQNNLNIHIGNMESVEEAESKQAQFAQMAEMFQSYLQTPKGNVIDV